MMGELAPWRVVWGSGSTIRSYPACTATSRGILPQHSYVYGVRYGQWLFHARGCNMIHRDGWRFLRRLNPSNSEISLVQTRIRTDGYGNSLTDTEENSPEDEKRPPIRQTQTMFDYYNSKTQTTVTGINITTTTITGIDNITQTTTTGRNSWTTTSVATRSTVVYVATTTSTAIAGNMVRTTTTTVVRTTTTTTVEGKTTRVRDVDKMDGKDIDKIPSIRTRSTSPKVRREHIDYRALGNYAVAKPELIRLRKMLRERLEIRKSEATSLIVDYCTFVDRGYRQQATPKEVHNGKIAVRRMKTAIAMRALNTHKKDSLSENIVSLLNVINLKAFPRANPNTLAENVLAIHSTPPSSRKKRKSATNRNK